MGTDMSVFETPERAASWTGLSPGNHESAGKRKSTRTTKCCPAPTRHGCSLGHGRISWKRRRCHAPSMSPRCVYFVI
ncbi:Transposase [Geobacillus sp. WSUCF1]|nr:Transposase [Geobacillus sp. WSUCF1]